LEPLTKFIEFNRIKGYILTDIIEPLEIAPSDIILDVYRQRTKSNNLDLIEIRGIPSIKYRFRESDCVWDESVHGSKLIIEDNGKVVYTQHGCGSQSVRAKMPLDNKGIFEWDFVIEKCCVDTWVGVCASENFSYECWSGKQPTGWVLGSTGRFYWSGEGTNYCSQFRKDDTKVTVHLNMNKKDFGIYG
jgi:hypothetical protein